MQKYELTVLLKVSVKNDDRDKFVDRIEKLVKALDGAVLKFVEMGVKQLAYRIGGAAEAQYLGWSLEVPSAGVVQLSKKLTNEKEILRHLLVTASEAAPKAVKIRKSK